MTGAGSRRVLITGLASTLAGRLAQRLEVDPRVQRIIGIDADLPRHRLERTQFVHTEGDPGLIDAVIRSAAIDTVVEARAPDASRGLRSLLAALDTPGSAVGKLVVSSSAHGYGYGQGNPAFLTEEMTPARPAPRGAGRAVIDAEATVRDFSARHPQTTVTVLRFAEPIGPEASGPHMSLLGLPFLPSMLGFDPRWQLLEQHDMVGALLHAIEQEVPGAYNVAADGVLALSEIGALLEKPVIPVLLPIGLDAAARALRRAGLPAPLELVQALRYGRGLDNRRFKAAGFTYRYTTREAVLRLRDHQRQRPALTVQGTLQER